jgi:hypothetical protein
VNWAGDQLAPDPRPTAGAEAERGAGDGRGDPGLGGVYLGSG